MKGRLSTLDKKISEAIEEREVQAREQAAIAIMAQKEAALTACEQAEYSAFLKEDFFTKRDFGRLEQFYAHAYDRLSEEGKDEMSHRVWEGVRHGEYRLSDLPKDVRDKEEDRVYAKFLDPSRSRDSLEHIPEKDRNDFILAYKAGDRKEAGDVLNRESFRRSVAPDDSNRAKHQMATAGKEADDHSVLAGDKPKATVPDAPSAMAKIKSASEKLMNLTLDDSPAAPSAASIPGTGASQVSGRSPA